MSKTVKADHENLDYRKPPEGSISQGETRGRFRKRFPKPRARKYVPQQNFNGMFHLLRLQAAFLLRVCGKQALNMPQRSADGSSPL